MHESALARAAAPAPAVVLGMLLRPLSLGHMILLHREEIMEPISNGSVTSLQLTTSVLICCQSWEQSQSMQFDWLLTLKLWIWKRRVARAESKHAKRLKAGAESGTYFNAEAAKFAAYMAAGSLDLPISDTPRADAGKPVRSPGSPFLLRLHLWLIRYLGLTEAQAWDHPYGLAKMRWSCHWESEGGLDVYNNADDSFNRYVQEQESLGAQALDKEDKCQV